MHSSYLLSRRLLFLLQKYIPSSWKNPPLVKVKPQHSLPTSTKWENSTIKVSQPKKDSPKDSPMRGESPIIDSLLSSIKTFSTQGYLSNAFKAFSLLQAQVQSTSLILDPISSLLLSCTTLKALPQGKQLHAHTISLGFDQDPLLVTKLVSFYSSFTLLIDAHAIAQNYNATHAVPWNVLISAYVRNGFFREALSAFKQMGEMGFRPDNYTYPSVLKACGEEFDLGFGREVHRSVYASGLEWSLFVHNALVSMYSKCGAVGEARELFERMPERDVVSWNAMISGYASRGMWMEAFELFERMRMGGAEVNSVTWNTIAGGNLQMGNYTGALELISQMRVRGTGLDSVAVVIGLAACSRTGSIRLGKEIHGTAIRCHCDLNESVRNALITMYSRCKDLKHAYLLFQMAETRNLITWNCMITGYTHLDRSEEASFVFRDMLSLGVEPNYVTVASILPLCARVANLQHGKELHCYIIRRKSTFEEYLLIWNSLVDMYSKSGRVSDARRVFNTMSQRDEVSYTSLMAGYGMQGEGETALRLFDEMIRCGIKPDHITMVAVLSACSHSGLVAQGQMLFEKMVSLYNIIPKMEHFACMVDLFGRAGLLRKAEEIITRMPFRPSPAMWGTLVGACKIHGNMEIGEWAAGKLLEMKPRNPGYYVLIANMYAAVRRWDKLAEVRTLMRDLGLRKTPGYAWIDVGDGFCPFLVGDRSMPQAREVYVLLEELAKHMKEAGYVANEDLGLEIEMEE
ncbi:pentatricopeptide repeat-containing protein At1g71490-like [Magnolia sinica]|uniref:pentatricopeptide repeat-containing protein At1g71490-like n=1 Tax=Magnolia sinica TaxID=86752 RepID=UPI00265A31B7|nr:pentatricopeptide repeat-containing protein At1g71490-like [Magnolia sinica]